MDPDLKTASKIFIFLLFTFIIFSHWVGEADNSSIDTTISIVEQGTFSIDEYHNNTRDKSYFDGHYYSDKAPLISFMAVPSYLLVDAIYPENYRPDFYLESFRRSFSDKLSLARFLAIITVTGVFGGILGAIIYLILREMNTEKKTALMISLVGSLGTLIFPYSTTFHPTIVGTTFLFSALYIWIKSDYDLSMKGIGFVAFLLGLGISASYLIVIPGSVMAALIGYKKLKTNKYRHLFTAIGGGLLGLTPLIIYNIVIFGHPFDLTIMHNVVPPSIYDGGTFEFGLGIVISKMIRSLFGFTSGVFIFSPILLLGLVGLKKLRDEQPQLFLFISGSLAGSLLLIGLLNNWITRVYFGARYLTPVAALLILPIVKVYDHSSLSKKIFGVLCVGSIAIQLTSTQPWMNSTMKIAEYYNRLMSFAPFENRLVEYTTRAPEQALQSPLISYLSGASENLNMVLSSYPDYSFVIAEFTDFLLVGDTRILALALIISAFALIFRELLQTSGFYTPEAGIFLGILLLFAGLQVPSDTYMDNWYDREKGEKVQWGEENPEILLKNRDKIPKNVLIRAQLNSPEKRELSLKLNDKVHSTRTLSGERTQIAGILKLKPGYNRLSFDTEKRCTVLGRYNDNEDTRCVTVGIDNLNVSESYSERIYPGNNVENIDGNYIMRRNATVLLVGEGKFSIEMQGSSIGDNTVVEFYRDGEKFAENGFETFGTTFSSPYIDVNGFSHVRIATNCSGSCNRLNISHLDVRKLSEQPDTLLYSFGENWYQKSDDEDYRWSHGNNSIFVYSYDDRNVNKILWLEGKSFAKKRNITYSWNNRTLGVKEVRETDFKLDEKNEHMDNKYGFNVTMEPGVNVLKLNSSSSCTEFSEVNDNNDVRCGFYGFKSLYLTDHW